MILSVSPKVKLPTTFDVTVALTALAVVVGGWLVYRVGRTVIRRAATPKFIFREESSRRADTARGLLLSVWKYVVAFVVLAALVSMLPSALLPAVAITGTVGLIIAFGAQTLIKDVLAGFSILLEGQLGAGDRVRLYGVEAEGTVEGIGLRVTVLRDDDGSRVFIPNGAITAVRNFSMAPPGAAAESAGRRRTRNPRSRPRPSEEPGRGRPPARHDSEVGFVSAQRPQRQTAPDTPGDVAEQASEPPAGEGVAAPRPRTRRGGRGRGGRGSGSRPGSARREGAAEANEGATSPREASPQPAAPAPEPAAAPAARYEPAPPRVPQEPPAPESEPAAPQPRSGRPFESPQPKRREESTDGLDDSPWSIE